MKKSVENKVERTAAGVDEEIGGEDFGRNSDECR